MTQKPSTMETWLYSDSDLHLFDSRFGNHLLVVDGSRIYDIDAEFRAEIESSLSHNLDRLDAVLRARGLKGTRFVDDLPLEDPPLRNLSLAIAQKCNLACGYCYAQGGTFGSEPKAMSWEVAKVAIERLLEHAEAGGRVTVAYLGGEPLVNRGLLRHATEYAALLGRERGIHVSFSVTTNGTLVSPEDGEFFERFGFAVTVSIDGIGSAHDRLRPLRGGQGSYQQVLTNVKPLLAMQERMQVSARATITPLNLDLPGTLDELIGLGFHSVGFAPTLSSAQRDLELDRASLPTMLERMVECGRKFELETIAGRRYPFSNLSSAMKELHRGTHRPYPCGAGAGYLGVSADGGMYACHRFVGDPAGYMGDLRDGIERARQNKWLADRHVHRQEPCKSCWARYLCGGGCHHEVINRGRPACDYIRGWLNYCLEAYVNIYEQRPDFFGLPMKGDS
jgi:uncharacterized protein